MNVVFVVVVVVVVVVSSAMGLSSNPAHVSNRKRMKAHRKKNIFCINIFFFFETETKGTKEEDSWNLQKTKLKDLEDNKNS